MPNCSRCGKAIDFRVMDGRRVPLHVEGGGWACSGHNASLIVEYTGYSSSVESRCFVTRCPECRSEVYFIRHNGGSVWIDSPLGPPWYRHPCMDKLESAGETRNSLLSDSGRTAVMQRVGLVVGVVKEAETSGSKRCTVINIETGKDQNLFLFLKNSAGFLVGRLVIYDRERQAVWWVQDETCVFSVVSEINAAPKTQGRTHIRCPECSELVDKLSVHLKAAHAFPKFWPT